METASAANGDSVIGVTAAIIGALPWIVTPIVTAIRVSRTKTLDAETGIAPVDAPPVSVVIPARNEARNIERCLRSVLTSDYPALEVVVVDDQSSDGTGEIARSIAESDLRARVMETGSPPEGWFGKQWACNSGATATEGEIILFTDADTFHSRDLITRSVSMMTRRNADLFSVAGRQELGSFWEKVIQPLIFGIMAVRYGGTESVSDSRFAVNKIANGQCLFVRRDTYEELGGHSLVKSHVGDDLMMAQRYFANGKRVVLAEGPSQLSTRMYTSLRELIDGWGKNVFAAGRDSVPPGALGRIVFPLLLFSAPLFTLLPAMVLLAAAFTEIPRALLLWAVAAEAAQLLWWIAVYARMKVSPVYALLTPLGALVVLYIFARAAHRGQTVEWKGRRYVSR